MSALARKRPELCGNAACREGPKSDIRATYQSRSGFFVSEEAAIRRGQSTRRNFIAFFRFAPTGDRFFDLQLQLGPITENNK